MPKFTVRVTGSAVVWKDVEVEAETAEAALEAVNDGQVEDIEQQHGWELSEGGNGVDDWETTGDVYDDEGEDRYGGWGGRQCNRLAELEIVREFLADIEAVGVPKVAKDWPDLIVTYNMAKMFLSGVRPKVDAKPNTGLVWDDSRIQEAADVAYKAVIDFLESFADGPDAMLTGAVAHRVELLVRADLKRWAEGQDPLPFAFLQDIIHMPLNFEKVKNKSSTNALG